MPRKYPQDFKHRAIRLLLDHEGDFESRSVALAKISKQIGISTESLRRWVAQAEVDSGGKPGVTTAQSQEIALLRKENRRLREANEVLKAASIFFAGELDPRKGK